MEHSYLDTSEDLQRLAKVLDPEEKPNGDEIIIRKGTKEDIIEESDGINDDSKQENNFNEDGNYTEDEFNKEFNSEYQDPDEVFEDDNRQNITNYSITDRDELNVEDIADTISSSNAFRGKSKTSYVLRVVLPREDPKTIDLDVHDSKLIMFSHKYKMRVYFPKKIVVGSCKSSFVKESNMLEVILRQQ